MIIYDWDDTLQKNLNPQSSIGMFLKTIFYPCNSELVKNIFLREDATIITTRSRLYTFAIKIKCFLITKTFKAFSDSKVTTINPYFFYRPKLRRPDHVDLKTYLEKIQELKIRLASIYNEYAFELDESYTYVDLDLCKDLRKEEFNVNKGDPGP